MADFITLSCPSCGAKLSITNDIERFACSHCGNEHIVKRSGGIISLLPVVETLKKVEVGVDKTASELAINRLQREIDILRLQRQAIIKSSPRPNVNHLFFYLIVIGLITAVALPFILPNSGYQCLIGIGVIMIVIGLIPYFNLPSARRKWQDNFKNRISLIDENIARTQKELEAHRKIVS